MSPIPARRSRLSYHPLLLATVAALAVAGVALVTTASADTTKPIERFIAFAVNTGVTLDPRPSRSGSATVQISIDRWSTETERDELIGTLRTKGEDGLLKALQENPPVGTIRTPDTVAWDLHYARERPTPDGGRDVILGTDRPIRFWEAANLTRSSHYPFTVIQLHLDKDGHGTGKMSIATRIQISQDGKTIELENYATQPVRLLDVAEQR